MVIPVRMELPSLRALFGRSLAVLNAYNVSFYGYASLLGFQLLV
jgi:hypothetical protein